MRTLCSSLLAAAFLFPSGPLAGFRAGQDASPGASAASPQPPVPPPGEYRVKAEFLLNFAKLTEWPSSAFERPDSPITICLVGRNPFGAALDDALRNETAGGHPLQARLIQSVGQADDCHMIFVPRGRGPSVPELLRSSRRAAVTVGESPRFLDEGGAIRFVIDSGRVRFDINTSSAEKQGVKFSSDLLRLARRAGPGGSR